MDKTKEVLVGMLTENTGRHMLDSGGAYGRNWEHNQGRDFESEPESTLSYQHGFIDVTLSVYHWLASRLDYDADLDKMFHEWAEATEERKDAPWLALMEEFVNDRLPTVKEEVAGLYGGDAPFVVNTYNGEDLLSQVIQYLYFEVDGESCVLLQIHGGCDVRGGYTAPRAFRVVGHTGEGTDIFENDRASISCDGNSENQGSLPGFDREWPHQWETDDACHWYRDGASGSGVPPQLETYDVTKEEDGAEWEEGKVHVKEDGSILCPVCGSTLSVSFF